MGVRRILRNNREQPRVASVLLSDYAKPFTHIFNFSDDHFKNLVSGSTGLVNATGGAQYLTLSSGIGPGIVGLSASNEAEGYISVTGNPFATSTCTYLWVESATTLDTNGSCIATSRYSKTSTGEIAALQVRITETDIYVLRAQQAVTLTASSARIAGALNVGAVTVNGNNGRHAAFSGGRLVASATPTTTYTHGTSGIFNTVEADALNFLGPMALFAFAPTALPDDMMIRLTENPYRLFDVRTGRKFFIPSAGGGGATITPTGLSSSAFGSFSVNAGDRIISFTGKASDEAFGSFSLRAKRLVSFTGKSSDEAFGAFSVHPGSVSILLNSKTTDEAYGTHSLLSGQKVISPTAKGSDSAFGSFIIVSGDRILLINGIASNEAFGAFSVNNNTANQTIIPSGYFDSSIGSFSLRPDQYIIFSGKEYLEFGQFLLSGSAVVRAMHFFDWIAQQPGLRGTLNDKLYQYLIAQGFTGSTPTMMFLWLRSLGYTGNTASMLTAFERDYTTRWY